MGLSQRHLFPRTDPVPDAVSGRLPRQLSPDRDAAAADLLTDPVRRVLVDVASGATARRAAARVRADAREHLSVLSAAAGLPAARVRGRDYAGPGRGGAADRHEPAVARGRAARLRRLVQIHSAHLCRLLDAAVVV